VDDPLPEEPVPEESSAPTLPASDSARSSGTSGAAVDPPPPGRTIAAFPSLLRRVLLSPWTYVAIAAIGPFLWGRPWGDLLYGQDSVRTVQPFSFNDSPFIPYSYLYSSSFPVPDFTPNFYLDASLRVFDTFGAPDWISQRLLLSLFAGLAAGGIVVLLQRIERIRQSPRPVPGWVFGAAALMYVYNPFTLTVTFWHVEGWAPFLAFLPWMTALVVRSAFEAKVPARFAAATVLLGIYLAPGVVSSFAVPVTFLLLGGILAVWLQSTPAAANLRSRVSRSALLLGVGIGLEGWGFVPLLVLPKVAYSNNNFVNPSNLVQIYHAAAWTWSPYPVLSLTAFSWLRATPSAYPWIPLLPVVAAAAVVFPRLAILGAERLQRSPGSLLVFVLGLAMVPLMIGAGTTPIANWNLDLLRLGGPFLVLVAAYYILGPVYLLLPVVGLYETLRERLPAWGDRGTAAPSARPRRLLVLRRPSGLVAIVVVLLLVLSALPFVVGDVYQTAGPNADVVAVPPSYPALAQYFGTPPDGPNTFVLVVPMSSQEGPFLDLGGSQFLDTSDLLSSYIPYPILESDTGLTATAIEDALSLGIPSNLTAMLDHLHVGSVVVNPFANRSAPAMNQAPDGAPIDWSGLLAQLPVQLGTGASAGEFTVYRVPGAIPLGWASDSLTAIVTPSPVTALDLLGNVRSAPAVWQASSVWDPNASLPGWEIRPVVVAGPSSTVVVPSGWTPSAVNANGSWAPVACRTGTCASEGTTYSWSSDLLTLSGMVERSTERPDDWLSATNLTSEGFCTDSGTSPALYGRTGDLAPAFVEMNGSFSSFAANDWVNVEVSAGRLGLLAEVYQAGPGGRASLSVSATENSSPFAWENVFLPAPLAPNASFAVALGWNSSSAFATVNASGIVTSSSILFGDPASDASNPGFDARAAPSAPVEISSANVSVGMVGGSACIQSGQVVRPPSTVLVVETRGAPPAVAPSVARNGIVTASGDVEVTADRPANSTGPVFAVLGYPENSLWVPSSPGGATPEALPGTPLDNVVEVVGGSSQVPVTFHFRTYLIVGLEASWVEGAGLVVAVVGLTWLPRGRQRRAGRRRPSSSTPGSPDPGSPPEPAP
jgi:hypothetical protein